MKKMLKEYLNKDIKLNKKELISVICMIIVFSGVFGWLYEFLFYYLNSGFKTFYMRGGNFLPWIKYLCLWSFFNININV